MKNIIEKWSSDKITIVLHNYGPNVTMDEDCNVLTYENLPITAVAEIMTTQYDVLALPLELNKAWDEDHSAPEYLEINTSLRDVVDGELDFWATDGTIDDECRPHFEKILEAIRIEADRLEKIINDGVWKKP